MVNIKLGFNDWFILWFDNTNQVVQNSKQKFRQSSIVFEKPRILPENWKLWRAPTTVGLNTCYWDFAHISHLSMSTKTCSGFILICLDLELFAKIKKDMVSTNSQKPVFFTFLLITQDLNKAKKSRTPFSRHCYVENVCKTSAKNVKLCDIGSPQSFQFFRQVT